jgi:hypothetical protein
MVVLLYVIQQYTLYVGYFLLITGIFGNIMNIYILSAVSSYRLTPSTFYFLIASIYDIIVILVGLFSRILEIGHGLNWSNSSAIWCKIRQYLIVSTSVIPFYCQCFATIDQFLVTSKNRHLRQFSTIKRTYWIIIILTIICLLHGIPFFIYYDISPKTNLCSSINVTLSSYLSIYVLVIFLFIPALLTIIFGFLTYQNVKQSISLHNQHADRQITLMIFMQIILLLTDKITKDKDRFDKELLISTIVTLNAYVHTGVCIIYNMFFSCIFC